jgi:ADP-heptose:LPS heptosyltransferase
MRIKTYILRRFTRKKSIDFDIRKAKNILFLRYDRIGDMVITTPVFRELKLAYPEINITVLASKANHCVLLNNPYVDRVITNHKNNLLKDLPTLLALRKEKFDVCVEFDHSVIPHAILRLKIIKPRKIISVIKEGRYGVKGDELKLYDYFTEKPKDTHFRDIWLNTLRPFGVVPKSNEYDLYITDKQEEFANIFLKQYYPKCLIGINLEGAVKGKRIQFVELEQICKGLYQANNNIQIIILAAPNNLQITTEKVAKITLDYVVTSYKTETILDVAAVIKHLDLVITPDTSIVHIASAFNIPIVTIHEDNRDSHQLFAPTSKYSRTVFSEFSDRLDGYNVSKIIENSINLIAKNEG